jgi:hypothetical protein
VHTAWAPLSMLRAETQTGINGLRTLQTRMRRQPGLETPLCVRPVTEQLLPRSAERAGVDIAVRAVQGARELLYTGPSRADTLKTSRMSSIC